MIKGGYLPLEQPILRVVLFLHAFTYIPKHINFSKLTKLVYYKRVLTLYRFFWGNR